MLKLTAIATVLNVFFFGFGYARANVKEVAAPLQPPPRASRLERGHGGKPRGP
jgi:hypothetical protein